MKKIFALTLVLAMVFGLCACGESETKTAENLKVGYAKVNITPQQLGCGLDGYSDAETRKAETLIDYVYTTCVAVSSGEETILMITFDSCSANLSVQKEIRGAVSLALGISDEKIFIGATHTHSAPNKGDGSQAMLNEWCVEAAKKAIADQSPATMLAAKPEFPGMNFVRHYQNDDGTYVGSNFGYWGNLVRHATETDPNGVLVKFDRGEDKKDILMVNWQAHPDDARSIGYNSIAAGWIGPLRDKLESLCGMHVAYFTGASGNQNKDSKIESEAHGLAWREYGEKMGELINEALPQLQPVEGAALKTSRAIVEVDINHAWDHMLKEANEVYELWKSTDKETGDKLGKTYDFSSVYQARAIRTCAAKGKSERLEINAFSIGDIGFTTGTYEMFSDAALFVKRNSPFETTFLITGNSGYIPTENAYKEYRCYESDTGLYAAGTAEKLADKYVEMLTAIK